MKESSMEKSTPTAVVLVVDDEVPVRSLIRRMLERHGYEVHEAGSGAEAIAALSDDRHIDLLIADLQMPGVTGEEMVRTIRAARPDLKVLYVSGHVDLLFGERPVLWEGEAFLDKPFTKQGLVEAVSLLLHGTVTVESP
jgi:two-component system, cell cycle sensor histidine kinase and response regulator CckA